MLQTYSSPTVVPLEPEMSIPGALRRRARTTPDQVIVERHVDGAWQPRTAREFYEEVLDLARGLVAWGLEPGEKVGIMGHTSYEWTLADFAIWSAGGIPVSIYETSSPEQIAWIGTDSELVLVMAESEQLAERVRQAGVPHIRDVQLFGDIPALVGAGVEVEIAEVVRRTEALAGGDLATIIYTSGTTGQPKGVELAHQSFLYLAQNGARSSLHVLLDDPSYRTLLFMPLAHVFARFIEVLCITEAGILGHAPGAKHLVADMQSFRPTFLLAVPRVFEKVFNSAQQSAATGVRKRLFSLATKTAITYSRALDTPVGPSRALKAQHAVAMRLVLNRIREAMGGQLQWAISGGAPLGERLGHFYRGIGVTVLEGYGMTETTAPTTVNIPEHVAIGTVGPAYAGTEIGIADDGEIVVRGPHVFMRYHNNPRRRRRPSPRGVAAHRRPGQHRRARAAADHRAPQGAHHHRRRQERLPRRAGGPLPWPPVGLQRGGGRRSAALHRRPGDAGRGDAARMVGGQGSAEDDDGGGPPPPGGARLPGACRPPREPRGLAGGVDPADRDPRG